MRTRSFGLGEHFLIDRFRAGPQDDFYVWDLFLAAWASTRCTRCLPHVLDFAQAVSFMEIQVTNTARDKAGDHAIQGICDRSMDRKADLRSVAID